MNAFTIITSTGGRVSFADKNKLAYYSNVIRELLAFEYSIVEYGPVDVAEYVLDLFSFMISADVASAQYEIQNILERWNLSKVTELRYYFLRLFDILQVNITIPPFSESPLILPIDLENYPNMVVYAVELYLSITVPSIADFSRYFTGYSQKSVAHAIKEYYDVEGDFVELSDKEGLYFDADEALMRAYSRVFSRDHNRVLIGPLRVSKYAIEYLINVINGTEVIEVLMDEYSLKLQLLYLILILEIDVSLPPFSEDYYKLKVIVQENDDVSMLIGTYCSIVNAPSYKEFSSLVHGVTSETYNKIVLRANHTHSKQGVEELEQAFKMLGMTGTNMTTIKDNQGIIHHADLTAYPQLRGNNISMDIGTFALDCVLDMMYYKYKGLRFYPESANVYTNEYVNEIRRGIDILGLTLDNYQVHEFMEDYFFK